MSMRLKVTNRSLQRNLALMRARAPRSIETLAKTLASVGQEYARDIVTAQIYATPERSGYRRTRFLIRSIYGQAERGSRGRWLIRVGAAANYAAYNELGTYDGYLGEGAAEDRIIQDARAFGGELIVLEYGDPERGLEPRPFILPALVMTERETPKIVAKMLRRLPR